MKVSLKRAHRLEREADRLAQAVTIKVSNSFSVFSPEMRTRDSLETAISRLTTENEKSVALSDRLFNAAQSIRTQLLRANQSNGIVELLLVQNLLAVRIKIFKKLVNQITDENDDDGQITDTAIATAKARRERSTADRYGYDSDKLSVTVTSTALLTRLENLLRLWQDESNSINEQLTVKNVTETITLTKSVIDVLIEAKIISAAS
jgi:hypothetical protein